MYKGKKVSIVMSTYNEKDSIRECIENFNATGNVDEIIIVDNNAAVGTVDEVRKTNAKLVHESQQGYGYGFRKGLESATGDLLVMCEPDGTFLPSDLPKFLVYSEEMDVVVGSRTCSSMILDDANMGLFLKYGNYFVAKIVEFLFINSAPHLSDCGCTYRLLTSEAYEKLHPYFRIGKNSFGLEITLLALSFKMMTVEVPIHYNKRIGESAVTGSFFKAFKLGIWMIGMSAYYFLESVFKRKKPISSKDRS